MAQIVEIIPDDLFEIPWIKNAIERGQLFNELLKREEKMINVLQEAKELQEDSGASDYAYGAREALAWVLGEVSDNEFELSLWCKSLSNH